MKYLFSSLIALAVGALAFVIMLSLSAALVDIKFKEALKVEFFIVTSIVVSVACIIKVFIEVFDYFSLEEKRQNEIYHQILDQMDPVDNDHIFDHS